MNKILITRSLLRHTGIPAYAIDTRSPELEKAIKLYGSATAFSKAMGVNKNTPSKLRNYKLNMSWRLCQKVAMTCNGYAGHCYVSALTLLLELGDKYAPE